MAAEKQGERVVRGFDGVRLRSAREAKGWSQTELAYHVGLNTPDVSRYETETREPRSAVVARLAVTLGVSSDYLLGLTDSPKPYPRA